MSTRNRAAAAPRAGKADRHLAAVATSLGWALESAERGNYADALGWIQVVEATGEQLSPAYHAKRLEWRNALANHPAKPGRT